MSAAAADPERVMTVLVYSDDRSTRQKVALALGRRPAPDVPRIRLLECATRPAVLDALDAGGVDVAVFDGEAVPTGGIGLARQVKEEIYRCPPVLVLLGRPQDAWLATWSRAEAAVSYPLDPLAVASTVAALLRTRLGAPAVTR